MSLTLTRNGPKGLLMGAEGASRTVMRSENSPSPGRGRNGRTKVRTTPYRSGMCASTSLRFPPEGHQNSSASELITQSAPRSAAAVQHLVEEHPLELAVTTDGEPEQRELGSVGEYGSPFAPVVPDRHTPRLPRLFRRRSLAASHVAIRLLGIHACSARQPSLLDEL